MPRPQRAPTPPTEQPLNQVSVRDASQTLNELAALQSEAQMRALELGRKLGYEGSLDPDVLEEGIESDRQAAVLACLNTGVKLLLLKEVCPHGEFIARLERRGWERTVAHRFMAAALKFSNVATSHHLKKAIGNQSKLFELLVLDQEEIAELAEEGAVHGITVDAIDAMGVRELRRALRDAKDTIAAKERVIEKKNERLDALEEAREKRRDARLPEQEAAQMDALRDDTLAAEHALLRMLTTVDAVMAAPASEAAALAARHSLDYVVRRLAEACLDRGITVDLAEQVNPAWLAQIDELVAKGRALDEQKAAGRAAARAAAKAAKAGHQPDA